ncbi:MAG: RDD family protein, partial [Gammaproteobacteria bacterium]
DLPVAGLGARSYAFVIDWHIRIALLLAWFLFVIALGLDIASGWSEVWAGVPDLGLLVLAPPLALYFLYHPVLEVLYRGSTPGKRLAGVRIVASDGQDASTGALVIRNVFRLVDSLPGFYLVGIITVLMTRQQLRIGDLAAGTLLVYESGLSSLAFAALGEAQSDLKSWEARETALALLERWGSLDKTTRRSLATALLRKRGIEHAGATDRKLRAALTAITRQRRAG